MTESFKLLLNRLLAISGRFFIPNIRTELYIADELKIDIMTEYELDKFCEKQKNCGFDCMNCKFFEMYYKENREVVTF